ncbi:S8 family serine peptidase [Streptomyces sp. R21]|uniref:S8 family serine peptidase n=1 Tax=Streptomyces sp. R21 TaxID=3238627 RepID=A0AB39NYW4_9ACTN
MLDYSRALDRAVDAAAKQGVFVVAGAGDEDQDACDASPFSTKRVLTVGGGNTNDERSWPSNWGACVDIFAPGKGTLSTWRGSTTDTHTLSGTAAAAAHGAGVAAYLLSLQRDLTHTTPAALTDEILRLSVRNKISDAPGHTPNQFLRIPALTK